MEITKEDLVEQCGFEKVKGVVLTVDEQHKQNDIFIPESDMKEYYYHNETDMFFETLDECFKYCKNEAESNSE